MPPEFITHKQAIDSLMGQPIPEYEEEEEEDEFGNSITYRACVDPNLSFPNARAAADWMDEQERLQAKEKHARDTACAQAQAQVRAEAQACADAEVRASGPGARSTKETVRAKEKRAARKWLAALGEPEKQPRGPTHVHAKPAGPSTAQRSSTEAARVPSTPKTSDSNPTAPEPGTAGARLPSSFAPYLPVPPDPNVPLPNGYTFYEGLGYWSPDFNHFSSHPPGFFGGGRSVPPTGEDQDRKL